MIKQKILFLVKEYLTFNRQEQRGIVVLSVLLFILMIGSIFISRLAPDKPFDFTAFEKEILVFEKEVATSDSAEEAEIRNRFRKAYGQGYILAGDTGNFRGKGAFPNIRIELNSADTLDLQRLKGIGPSFARRIVRYRERLGGYYDKSQLLEVWGMDTGRYHGIAANLTVNRDSVRKMDLNRVTFKKLLSHPYFPFEVAKTLIIYRKEHHLFQNLEEVRSVPGIHDSLFRKIRIYLEVSGR